MENKKLHKSETVFSTFRFVFVLEFIWKNLLASDIIDTVFCEIDIVFERGKIMRKIYETIAEALAERKNQLAMKRGIAMLLALSIMLLAVPTVAITAIYAEGDAETEETSGGETTVSTDADETGTTTSTAETTTTAATDDTTTAAEGETTTTTTENTSTASAGDDSVTTTASEVSTTASSTENTTTTSVDDNVETTTAAEETTTATTEATTTTTTAAAAPIADYGELKISMTTLLPTGSSMDLNFNATGTIYIDWGDGAIVEYSDSGITAGSNIKIYCTGNITSIICSGNQLSAIDVSNCRELTKLHCSDNGIYELDVTNNKKLVDLSCGASAISEIDLSNNTELVYLSCGDSWLSEIDLSNNPKLEVLAIYNNGLQSIDLSNNTELTYLDCCWNNFTELDISNNSKLTYIDCSLYNDLTFSTLPKVDNLPELQDFLYNLQDVVIILSEVVSGEKIDLSSEYDINGTKTVYTWYNAADDSVATPTTSENGVFTFDDDFAGKTLYCTMTNDEYPELTLTTTEVTVEGTIELGEPQIVMTTALPVGSNMEFSIYADTDVYVDWGDGKIVKQPYSHPYIIASGVTAGDTVKIYGSIMELYCDDNMLVDLDLSNANLTALTCNNNQLSSIDLSNQDLLISFSCAGNNISEIDTSSCNSLMKFNCENNKITELDFSNNLGIISLNCGNNKMRYSTMKMDIEQIKLQSDSYGGLCSYAPQAEIEIAETIVSDTKLADLASEYDIDGTKTVYIWYNAVDGSVVTPTTSENGVFSFGDDFVGKTLYCTMTNNEFPELTLTTTKVTVEEAKEEFEVVDKEDYVGEAEPSDDLVVEDEKGSEVEIGNVRLIIGNVAENNKKTVREAIEAYNKEFKATDNNHAMYDIRLETDKGVKVNIVDGRILICLKYPDNLGAECTDYTYHLYHIKDDGTVEEITIEAKPNGIWFYADDFSPYVLTYTLNTTTTTATTTTTTSTTTASTKSTVAGDSDKKEGNTPETGDNSLGTIIVMTFNLVLVMMMVSVLVFRWYQKSHTAAAAVDAEVMADAAVFDLIGIAELSQSDEFEDLE